VRLVKCGLVLMLGMRGSAQVAADAYQQPFRAYLDSALNHRMSSIVTGALSSPPNTRVTVAGPGSSPAGNAALI